MSGPIQNPTSRVRKLAPSGLELHIGDLVLDGFPPMDRAQLGAVIQQELARLFAHWGIPAGLAHGGEVASLKGGEFRMLPGANAPVIGAQIAQAIYKGLGQ